MKKINLSTVAFVLFATSSLFVGCSSKSTSDSMSSNVSPADTSPAKDQMVVAKNTNLGAGSSGYSR